MELESEIKITRVLDDGGSTDLWTVKDRGGPVFSTRESETMFTLSALLRGYKRDSIKINVNEDGTLIAISGEKPVQQMAMIGLGWLMYTRRPPSTLGFKKIFRVPQGVVVDNFKAKFKEDESILTIYMPKSSNKMLGMEIEEVTTEGRISDQKVLQDRDEKEDDKKVVGEVETMKRLPESERQTSVDEALESKKLRKEESKEEKEQKETVDELMKREVDEVAGQQPSPQESMKQKEEKVMQPPPPQVGLMKQEADEATQQQPPSLSELTIQEKDKAIQPPPAPPLESIKFEAEKPSQPPLESVKQEADKAIQPSLPPPPPPPPPPPLEIESTKQEEDKARQSPPLTPPKLPKTTSALKEEGKFEETQVKEPKAKEEHENGDVEQSKHRYENRIEEKRKEKDQEGATQKESEGKEEHKDNQESDQVEKPVKTTTKFVPCFFVGSALIATIVALVVGFVKSKRQ